MTNKESSSNSQKQILSTSSNSSTASSTQSSLFINKNFLNQSQQNQMKNPKNQINNARMGALSRAEKSLTALTTKFMTLLQESNNGILDLRSVIIIFK